MEIIGLYQDGEKFFISCLSPKKSNIVIQYLNVRDKLPAFNTEALIVTGVEGQYLLIRHLNFPLKQKRLLHKMLPLQLEPLIPYSLENVIVRPVYVVNAGGTCGTFFVVCKKFFENHLRNCQKKGVDPEWTTFVPQALFRFGQFICPQEEAFIVFHVGQVQTQLVSVKQGIIHSHLTIHTGERDFLRAFDLDKQEKTAPHLHTLLVRFKQEVDRAFCFFSHKKGGGGVDRILFCGAMRDRMGRVVQELESIQFSPVEIENYGEFDKETLCYFAVPIGLGLDCVKNDRQSVQLRQGPYISKHRLRGIKKGVLRGGVIALMLLIMTATYSYVFFNKRGRVLSKQIEKLAAKYGEKIPSLMQVKEIKGIENKIHFVNQKLSLPAHRDGYFSSPPLVSDLCVFIATHPKFEEVVLLQIDYELKSYPTLDHPQAKYLPKVRILFSSEKEEKAKEFHNAIVKESRLVNNDKEIEWNKEGNEYAIAFFLQV